MASSLPVSPFAIVPRAAPHATKDFIKDWDNLEVIERLRPDAPPIVKKERPRGSARLALRVAKTASLKKKALENFNNLAYAPSTRTSKDAKFAL
eukprot:4344180-Lingulodinium_polyedra.AAC.1